MGLSRNITPLLPSALWPVISDNPEVAHFPITVGKRRFRKLTVPVPSRRLLTARGWSFRLLLHRWRMRLGISCRESNISRNAKE